MIVIYLVLLAFVLAAAWLLSILIKREMQKRLEAQEERIKCLSATEEGKQILQEESEVSARKMKKWEPIFAIGFCFANLLFFAVGIFGVYSFVTEIYAGKRISDVFFSDIRLYLITPFAIAYPLFQLMNIVKAWVSSHKKSRNSAAETDK